MKNFCKPLWKTWSNLTNNKWIKFNPVEWIVLNNQPTESSIIISSMGVARILSGLSEFWMSKCVVYCEIRRSMQLTAWPWAKLISIDRNEFAEEDRERGTSNTDKTWCINNVPLIANRTYKLPQTWKLSWMESHRKLNNI